MIVIHAFKSNVRIILTVLRVSIWDLDYYYSTTKKNVFNADLMKISSYHKQSGDKVNFVMSENDINRPFDVYYICKENSKLPNPPGSLFIDRRVRWMGKAYKGRANWTMPDVILACRPDYLLYPERTTKIERSEHIRLFNNVGEPLKLVQNWENTFKNKYALVTDTTMWFASKNNIIDALKKLQSIKNVSFLEPIWLQKLLYDKDIREEFLKLKFVHGSKLSWMTAQLTDVEEIIRFVQDFKGRFPKVSIGEIVVSYLDKDRSHWEDRNHALQDFAALKKMIIHCKGLGIQIIVQMPLERLDTPYFFIFEELSTWTRKWYKKSWIYLWWYF